MPKREEHGTAAAITQRVFHIVALVALLILLAFAIYVGYRRLT